MTSEEFKFKVKEMIVDSLITDGMISVDDISIVYEVWYCKTLQNHKGLFGSHYSNDFYYEATYNGDKNELYLDVYKIDRKLVLDVQNNKFKW